MCVGKRGGHWSVQNANDRYTLVNVISFTLDRQKCKLISLCIGTHRARCLHSISVSDYRAEQTAPGPAVRCEERSPGSAGPTERGPHTT